jgi:hypothetical protein
VAVLDFDGNGWPDLYFTQGGGFPARAGRNEPVDRLFQNLGHQGSTGGSFTDVTVQALLSDSGYGQGVSAGDYNSDGFVDLYVANIGQNRLYQNNGDGTFCDVTDATGISGAVWTASCLLADLNGDGLADIDVSGRRQAVRRSLRKLRGSRKPNLSTDTV